jgi:hypothetical protein
LSNKPVSEKSIEILFNRCLLQSFPLGSIHLFAPTSFEEFRSGYDGKIVGKRPLREMYLQYKAPSFSEGKNRYTVQITPHQHKALQTLYPPSSAYYIAPMFRTLEEFKEAQTSLSGSVSNLLMHFVCVDAASVASDARFFNYDHTEHRRLSPRIRFKHESDGDVREGTHFVSQEDWCSGSNLLSKFKNGDVGTKVRNGKAEKLLTLEPQTESDVTISRESLLSLGESGFGSILRTG